MVSSPGALTFLLMIELIAVSYEIVDGGSRGRRGILDIVYGSTVEPKKRERTR